MEGDAAWGHVGQTSVTFHLGRSPSEPRQRRLSLGHAAYPAAARIKATPARIQNGSPIMKLPPMGAPSPCSAQTRPTSAAIAARTKRVRSWRGEIGVVTGVACIGALENAANLEATMSERDPAARQATDDARGAPVSPSQPPSRAAEDAPSQTAPSVEADRSGEPIGEHRRSGRLVMSQDIGRKMAGDPTMTEDRKLLEPSKKPAFLNTDPWRALRILA